MLFKVRVRGRKFKGGVENSGGLKTRGLGGLVVYSGFVCCWQGVSCWHTASGLVLGKVMGRR